MWEATQAPTVPGGASSCTTHVPEPWPEVELDLSVQEEAKQRVDRSLRMNQHKAHVLALVTAFIQRYMWCEDSDVQVCCVMLLRNAIRFFTQAHLLSLVPPSLLQLLNHSDPPPPPASLSTKQGALEAPPASSLAGRAGARARQQQKVQSPERKETKKKGKEQPSAEKESDSGQTTQSASKKKRKSSASPVKTESAPASQTAPGTGAADTTSGVMDGDGLFFDASALPAASPAEIERAAQHSEQQARQHEHRVQMPPGVARISRSALGQLARWFAGVFQPRRPPPRPQPAEPEADAKGKKVKKEPQASGAGEETPVAHTQTATDNKAATADSKAPKTGDTTNTVKAAGASPAKAAKKTTTARERDRDRDFDTVPSTALSDNSPNPLPVSPSGATATAGKRRGKPARGTKAATADASVTSMPPATATGGGDSSASPRRLGRAARPAAVSLREASPSEEDDEQSTKRTKGKARASEPKSGPQRKPSTKQRKKKAAAKSEGDSGDEYSDAGATEHSASDGDSEIDSDFDQPPKLSQRSPPKRKRAPLQSVSADVFPKDTTPVKLEKEAELAELSASAATPVRSPQTPSARKRIKIECICFGHVFLLSLLRLNAVCLVLVRMFLWC